MPDGGRKRIGGRNAEKERAKRAKEVRTEAKAEGKRKCEPGKPGKPRDGKEHKGSEERTESLGRRESGETGWAQEGRLTSRNEGVKRGKQRSESRNAGAETGERRARKRRKQEREKRERGE